MKIVEDLSWNTVFAIYNCFKCVNAGIPSSDDLECSVRLTEMGHSSAMHYYVRHGEMNMRHAWTYQHTLSDAIIIYLATEDQVEPKEQGIVPTKDAIIAYVKYNEHDEASRIIHAFLHLGKYPSSNNAV